MSRQRLRFEFEFERPVRQCRHVTNRTPLRVNALASAPAPLAAGEERVVRPKVVPVPECGVVVFESRHAPGFVGTLRDDFSKFLLVLTGRARWEAGGRQIAVAADSLVHIPAGLPHRQQDSPNDPVVLYAIHYRPALLPQFLRQNLVEQGLLHLEVPGYAPALARAVRSDFQEMLFEQSGQRQGWEWVLCSRLVELAVRAVRMFQHDQESRRPIYVKCMDSAERVARYAAQLQTRFYLHQSLDNVAAATGLSRRQFTELFRKITGESWRQHIQRLRLEHSRKLLQQTEKTVTAIAFESGFEDLSYFNHAFKKHFGRPPQAVRQTLQHPGRSGQPEARAGKGKDRLNHARKARSKRPDSRAGGARFGSC